MSNHLQFENFIRTLDQWGLTDVLLPFLLIFIIIYSILQKTKILGNEKKNFNVGVAVIIGLLVVIPHVMGTFPPNRDPVEILNKAIPQVSLIILAIIFLLILIGVFGQEEVFLGLAAPGWITLVSIIIILVIFGSAAEWWSPSITSSINNFFGTDVLSIVVMILVFGIIIAYIKVCSWDFVVNCICPNQKSIWVGRTNGNRHF